MFDVLRKDGTILQQVPSIPDAYLFGRPVDDILIRPSNYPFPATRLGIDFFGFKFKPTIDQQNAQLSALNRIAQSLGPQDAGKALNASRDVLRRRKNLYTAHCCLDLVDLQSSVFEPYYNQWTPLTDVSHGLYILEFGKFHQYYVGLTTRGIVNRVTQHFKPDTISVWWEKLLLPKDVTSVWCLRCQAGAVKLLEEDVISRFPPSSLLNTKAGGRYDKSETSIHRSTYVRENYRYDEVPRGMLVWK